jgi:hypothetical protein
MKMKITLTEVRYLINEIKHVILQNSNEIDKRAILTGKCQGN